MIKEDKSFIPESVDLIHSGFEVFLSQKIEIPGNQIGIIGRSLGLFIKLDSIFPQLKPKLIPGKSYQCNFLKIKKEHFIPANDALVFSKRRNSLFFSIDEFRQLEDLNIVLFPKNQKIVLLNEISMLEEDGYENLTIPIVIFEEGDSIGTVYKSNFEQQYNDEYLFLEILPEN
ncbi:MAG: hypothetical protein WCO58_00605 [bacterium]